MSIAPLYTVRRTYFRLGSYPTAERGNSLLYRPRTYKVSRCDITHRRIFLIRAFFLLLVLFLVYILGVGGILLRFGNLYILSRNSSALR